jgi:gamma-glutamylcyclotransferase (GGCT)/AIG2-like uncharacterized protein YtfP
VILFLYGTLLDPGVLARMAGEQALARRMRPARLAGWRRVFLRGTPYPTLLRDPASAVEGAVLRAGDAAFARLAAYEGSAYALVPVTVATAHGAVRARAWIAPPWRADPARPWLVSGASSSIGEAARRAPHATSRAASAPLSHAPATVAA